MARRRDARRLAIGILYQADLMARPPLEALEERRRLGERIPGFTEELVSGVEGRARELDEVIGSHAEEWTVERMSPVVRAVLRVGLYEMRERPDVPAAVAIDEAVEAAKELSGEDAAAFVNGILGRIARERVGEPNA